MKNCFPSAGEYANPQMLWFGSFSTVGHTLCFPLKVGLLSFLCPPLLHVPTPTLLHFLHYFSFYSWLWVCNTFLSPALLSLPHYQSSSFSHLSSTSSTSSPSLALSFNTLTLTQHTHSLSLSHTHTHHQKQSSPERTIVLWREGVNVMLS